METVLLVLVETPLQPVPMAVSHPSTVDMVTVLSVLQDMSATTCWAAYVSFSTLC